MTHLDGPTDPDNPPPPPVPCKICGQSGCTKHMQTDE